MGDPLIWLGILTIITGVICATIVFGWGWIIQQLRDNKALTLRAIRRRKNAPNPSRHVPMTPMPVRQTSYATAHPSPPLPPRPFLPSPPAAPAMPQRTRSDRIRNDRRPAAQSVEGILRAILSPPPHRTTNARQSPPSNQSNQTYHRINSLLTQGEQAFYLVLAQAVGTSFHITMKTRLADLVGINHDPRHPHRALNAVAQKHVDFVLADPKTLEPVLIVELDDNSHNQYKRRQRDKLVDAICREAGLRILHIKARYDYSAEIIHNLIADRLRRP